MSGAAFSFNLDPLEALVRDRHLQIGGLGDHGAIRAPARDQRIGADAGVLFINDARNHEATGVESTRLGDNASSANHRRHAALHILGAATIDAAVTLDRIERSCHTRDANRIDVAAVHQRTAGGPPLQRADHVRPSRRHFLDLDREADRG